VAEDRIGSRGEDGGQPAALATEAGVSNRVDAVTNRMEPSRLNPSIDFFFTETPIEQLPPRHHPMLRPRKSRDPSIIPAKPRQPVFKQG